MDVVQAATGAFVATLQVFWVTDEAKAQLLAELWRSEEVEKSSH